MSGRSFSRSRSRSRGKDAKRYSRSPRKSNSPKRSRSSAYYDDRQGANGTSKEAYRKKSISPRERSRSRELKRRETRSRSNSAPRPSNRDKYRSRSKSARRNSASKRSRSRSFTPKEKRDRNDSPQRRAKSKSFSRSPQERSNRQGDAYRRERSRSRSPVQKWRGNGRENPEESNVLGIFGMSLHTTERMLEDEFYRFGRLQKVQLIRDQFHNSRGFAFLTFERLEDARAAREEMMDQELDGRRIRIDYSITKQGHAATPGMGYKGRGQRSPRRDTWNDRSRRDGYDDNPRRSSRDYGGWDKSYGGGSRQPYPYDRRQDGYNGDEYRRRSRSRSPRR